LKSKAGLAFHELPALERALIPEPKLYREFFYLRIQLPVLSLRPSLAFDWNYEYPSIASDWHEGYESLVIMDPIHLPPGPIDGDINYMFMDSHLEVKVKGWHYEYPAISSLSLLFRGSVRSVISTYCML
jgi:hypothetical protein